MATLSNKIRRQLASQNPRLTVDLKAMFKKEVNDLALRQEIGQALIDRIVERTESSLFMQTRGKNPLRYSKAYIQSFEFRAFGKSPGRVNLTASGDMLRAIDIIDDARADRMVLGFDDSTNAEKAHGHITGAVGKMRDFWGLPEADVRRIASRYQDRVDALADNIFQGEERQSNENNIEFLLRVLGGSQVG